MTNGHPCPVLPSPATSALCRGVRHLCRALETCSHYSFALAATPARVVVHIPRPARHAQRWVVSRCRVTLAERRGTDAAICPPSSPHLPCDL